MQTLTEIKNQIKTKYDKLTNIFFLKLFLGIAILAFFAMWTQNSLLKVELYNQNEISIPKLKEQISKLKSKNATQDSILLSYQLQDSLMKDFVRQMFSDNFYTTSLTGYHPVPEQTDATPDVTADGTKFDINIAGEYKYVALSRDLLQHFNKYNADINFGDYIMIKGTPGGKQDGIYQVRDTMNKRHTEWIDILLTPGEKSFYYKHVLMYKITNPNYLSVLQDIYKFPQIEPIAKLNPEI